MLLNLIFDRLQVSNPANDDVLLSFILVTQLFQPQQRNEHAQILHSKRCTLKVAFCFFLGEMTMKLAYKPGYGCTLNFVLDIIGLVSFIPDVAWYTSKPRLQTLSSRYYSEGKMDKERTISSRTDS